MKAINEILRLSTDYLASKGRKPPRLLSELMVSSILNVRRMDLYLDFERPLNRKELDECKSWLKKLGDGEPIEYLQKTVPFLNCSIEVNPQVLIPRPETEELAEKIVQRLADQDLKGKTLWDVCSGSGCIGIAIKKALPQLEVVLSDISDGALEMSCRNARKNDVSVTCLKGDLLAPFAGKKADFIVSNPPYVSESEYKSLSPVVKHFEPSIALLGGSDGLTAIRRLAKGLTRHLLPQGLFWMEIGYRQGNDTKTIFENEGWTNTRVERDLSGRDRFFFLENE